MPSIKQKFYGIIRQFSSTQVVDDESGDRNLLADKSNLLISGQGEAQGAVKKPTSLDNGPLEYSFIHGYLSGRLKKNHHPEIYYGKTGVDLPVLHIRPLNVDVVAAYSGPDGGLTRVPPVRKRPMANIANLDDELNLSFDGDCATSTEDSCPHLAPPQHITNGFKYNLADNDAAAPSSSPDHFFHDDSLDWTNFSDRAFGLSTSLYERNPVTNVCAGNPVADVFAVCARRNSCVLALADGVNWGEKSRLAARCAIRGAVEQLNDSLFNNAEKILTTLDVFHCLLGAFHAGHHLILQEGGALTTLCVLVLCPLKDGQHWVACACNVGDSLAFVYSKTYGVREITLGSHDIQQMRDMRDAGGALGPVDGVNPELHNMTCSMTVVDPTDIVFITSDGVSDNFDPVVGKFCLIRNSSKLPELVNGTVATAVPTASGELVATKSPAPERRRTSAENGLNGNGKVVAHRKLKSLESDEDPKIETSLLPVVEAYQRHELMLLRMEDMLKHGVTVGDPSAQTAKDLCENLVNFATQLTMAKRKILEDPDLYQGDAKSSKADQRYLRKLVRQKISEMPGKLDHATCVAYCVGDMDGQKRENSSATTPEYEEKISSNEENGTSETPTPRRRIVVSSSDNDFLFESTRIDEEDERLVVLPEVPSERFWMEDKLLLFDLKKCDEAAEEAEKFVTKDETECSFDAAAVHEDQATDFDEDEDVFMNDFAEELGRVEDAEDEPTPRGVEMRRTPANQLSTIREVSSRGDEFVKNHRPASFDSDTLMVIITSDGRTTVPSSELDTYAISPPSVVENVATSIQFDANSDEAISTCLESNLTISLPVDDRISCTVQASNGNNHALATLNEDSAEIASTSTTAEVQRRQVPGRSTVRGEWSSVDDPPFSRLLNQSYYLATSSQEDKASSSNNNNNVSVVANGKVVHEEQQQAKQLKTSSTFRFKKFTKTWERFEKAVPTFRKPKKHARGSPQRHTVAVDVAQWDEYKRRSNNLRRAPSEEQKTPSATMVEGGEAPKRAPSTHGLSWSPIRSLKFFKSLTSPRHSKEESQPTEVGGDQQPFLRHVNEEARRKVDDQQPPVVVGASSCAVSASVSDSQIATKTNVHLESLV